MEETPQITPAPLPQPYTPKHWHWPLWAGLFVAAILVGGIGFYYWQSVPPPSLEVGTFTVLLEDLGINCALGDATLCNKQLVRVDDSGNREIIEENITKLFQVEFGEGPSFNHVIEEFYFPENSSTVFFSGFLAKSSGCCRIYSFNIDTKKFKPLQNGYYDPNFAGDLASQDHSKFVQLSEDGKSLEVITLTTDALQVVAQAGEGEVLRSYYEGYGSSPVGVFKWLNNSQIEYAVFRDEEQDSTEEMTPRDPIEMRVVNIGEEPVTRTSQDSSIVGTYERKWASITVSEIEEGKIQVKGSAVWENRDENGELITVNSGLIDGVVILVDNKGLYKTDGCEIEFEFKENRMIAKEIVNYCGGLNVSFEGEYNKK